MLLLNGDLLTIHYDPVSEGTAGANRTRKLLRMSWEGDLLWSAELPIHHDLDVLDDGRIAVLASRHRVVPELNASIPVLDDFLSILDPQGKLVEELSLTDLLLDSPDRFRNSTTPIWCR